MALTVSRSNNKVQHEPKAFWYPLCFILAEQHNVKFIDEIKNSPFRYQWEETLKKLKNQCQVTLNGSDSDDFDQCCKHLDSLLNSCSRSSKLEGLEYLKDLGDVNPVVVPLLTHIRNYITSKLNKLTSRGKKETLRWLISNGIYTALHYTGYELIDTFCWALMDEKKCPVALRYLVLPEILEVSDSVGGMAEFAKDWFVRDDKTLWDSVVFPSSVPAIMELSKSIRNQIPPEQHFYFHPWSKFPMRLKVEEQQQKYEPLARIDYCPNPQQQFVIFKPVDPSKRIYAKDFAPEMQKLRLCAEKFLNLPPVEEIQLQPLYGRVKRWFCNLPCFKCRKSGD